MNDMIQKLASQKWFVPLILFLLLVISVPSLNLVKVKTTETSIEQQVEALCNSVSGVSNAKVMISYTPQKTNGFMGTQDVEGTVQAIAVVCTGGENPDIRLTLHEILETLFQLSSTRITISERN